MRFGQVQNMPGCLSERFFLKAIEVVPFVLGIPINEECPVRLSVEYDGAVSTRLALSRARNALLQNATPKIGIDLAPLGPLDGVPQYAVRDALLSGKAHEPGVLEDSHPSTIRLARFI